VTEDQILDGVRAVIRDELRWKAPVTPSTHLVRDLELDSLKQLTLVVELEDRFRVRLEAGDEDRLETLGDLVRLIHRRLLEGAPRD
jgi:acyl carrier protein